MDRQVIVNEETTEIQNSLFTYNSITSYISSENSGGCLYISGGSVDINNCQFKKNTAVYGGCISVFKLSSLFINSSLFEENTALRHAGACWLYRCQEINIADCTFNKNIANYYYGAILINESKNSLIDNCRFTYNSAEKRVGSIGIRRCQSPVKIHLSSFLNNNAADLAIFVEYSSEVELYCLSFTGCKALFAETPLVVQLSSYIWVDQEYSIDGDISFGGEGEAAIIYGSGDMQCPSLYVDSTTNLIPSESDLTTNLTPSESEIIESSDTTQVSSEQEEETQTEDDDWPDIDIGLGLSLGLGLLLLLIILLIILCCCKHKRKCKCCRKSDDSSSSYSYSSSDTQIFVVGEDNLPSKYRHKVIGEYSSYSEISNAGKKRVIMPSESNQSMESISSSFSHRQPLLG